MDTNRLEFHPIIAPFANSFASTVAGFLGWRLINPEDFRVLLEQRGGNDRVALASTALELSGENVTFSFRNSVLPLVSGTIDHHRILSVIAQQLIGHCWELLRISEIVPQRDSPVFEFLRHVRNGCFHGNSFNFLGEEPRFPAEWRDLVITRDRNGERIFRSDLSDTEYFLNWGDPLLLLSDVSEFISEDD
jgi:hypothetical protein